MSDLLDYMAALEADEDVHLARILVLIKRFANDDKPAITGITKLAKLDFLLRYPNYFEQAMRVRGVSEKSLLLKGFERNSIEAKMVRYKFGPWDHRYRKFLNILASKGLVTLSLLGRTISVDLTEAGDEIAMQLAGEPEFEIIDQRSKLLKKNLDIGATKLMDFIYDTFPELHDMELNAEIGSEQLL
ncbi:MAG: hypothetical protein AAF950_14785 [Pseudomonadota bacterium]